MVAFGIFSESKKQTNMNNIIIKIALSGQFNNGTNIVFTYPEKFNPTINTGKNEWLRTLGETRDARVFNSDETFAFWKSKLGNYYAIIVPNDKDPRNGYIMLTLFLGRYVATSGKTIVDKLRELADLLIKQDSNKKYPIKEPDEKKIEDILYLLENHLTTDKSTYTDPTSKIKAFRIYSTEEDLGNILQNPNQKEYEAYERLLIVSRGYIPSNFAAQDYKEITSQIKKTYRIQKPLPKGVEVDRDTVTEGDTLKITYKRDTYKSQEISIDITGKSRREVYYEGTEAILQNAEMVGIEFYRSIKFDVLSRNGKNISFLSLELEGNDNICKRDNEIKLQGYEDKYPFKLKVKDYETLSSEVTLNDIKNGYKRIVLQPEKKEVKTILSTPDKGNISDSVLLSADNKLYPYFRSAEEDDRPINETRKKKKQKNKKRNIALMSIGIIIGIIIGIGGYFLYLHYGSKDSDPRSSTPPNTKSFDSIAVENNNNDSVDMAYLMKNDVWTKDSLKTSKYQQLIDFINRGQVGEVLSYQYFDKTNDVNESWTNIIDGINELQNKNPKKYSLEIEAKISEEMRRVSSSSSCNLKTLSSSIDNIKEQETSQSESQLTVLNKNQQPKPKKKKESVTRKETTRLGSANSRPISGN